MLPRKIATIVPPGIRFTHPDAFRVFDSVLRSRRAQEIIIDLREVAEATTCAFARLVLLRRELRTLGGDLSVRNLRDRAARLYEISRLDEVLPQS